MSANEGSSYDGGAGGKFRKKAFRKTQSTPYDRPPTTQVRAPSIMNDKSGWLSKLIVDRASRFFTASAHMLFRKRLTNTHPPPHHHPPPCNPESNLDSPDDVPLEENPLRLQDHHIHNPDSGTAFVQLEHMLKHKTFTRSEIEHLTSLLHARTTSVPTTSVANRYESKSIVASRDKEDEPAKYEVQENGIQDHNYTSTPIPSSRALEEDNASPTMLAKAYMGSRTSKMSPSPQHLRSPAFMNRSSFFSNTSSTPKSPIMSLVTNARVTENSAVTPRSRGRSAIYNMARAPYSMNLTPSSLKGSVTRFDAFGGASSSSQSRLEGNGLSSSKHVALKRGRYALDSDDIGAVGPIRRIRQKPNLLSSINAGLPVSGSPLSGTAASSRLQVKNGNSIHPATSCPIPSQSSEMAQKILQQLDKLAPSKDKPSELKLAIARVESPVVLTSSMLNGQGRRSLEDVDFSKFIDNIQDNTFDSSLKTSSPDALGSTSQKDHKVVENGPKKFKDQTDRSAAVNGLEATSFKNKSAPFTKPVDVAGIKSRSHSSPPKKWAFQMSAHEDYLDLDDDDDTNDIASNSSAEETKDLDTSVVPSKSIFSEAVKTERPLVTSECKPPANSIVDTTVDPKKLKGTAVTEKIRDFAFPLAAETSIKIQPIVPSNGTNSEISEVQPKGTNSTPIFSFSSNDANKVSPFEFSSTTSEFKGTDLGATSNSKLENVQRSISPAVVTGDATLIVSESDKVGTSTKIAEDLFRKTGDSLPCVVPTSSTNISFGIPANNLSENNTPALMNGSLSSSPSTFSSLATISNFNNGSSQNLFDSSTVSATSITPATTVATSSSSLSSSTVVPSSPAEAIFKFGSTVHPFTSVSPVPSGIESTVAAQFKQKQETTFDSLIGNPLGAASPIAMSTGNSIFGFGASTASLGSNPFGNTSGSIASTQASLVGTTETAIFTQSTPVQFGSTSSSPTFGVSEASTPVAASGSSPFGYSIPASSSANLFSSGASFGLTSSSASASEAAKSISSNNGPTSASLFGSSWQSGGKTPIFSSTLSNSAAAPPPAIFSFGASPTSTQTSAAASVFSFAPPTAATNNITTSSSTSLTPFPSILPSQSQPIFGNSAFTLGGGNKDQMSMEDTMAEDAIQTPSTTASAGFMFNSITPTPTLTSGVANPFQFGGGPAAASQGANPFQFGGGQQNQNPGQSTAANPFQFGNPAAQAASSSFQFGNSSQSNGAFQFGGNQQQSYPSSFQASGSLDFNSGGVGGGSSFSLGSGGGDKANRKLIKVKRNPRKK